MKEVKEFNSWNLEKQKLHFSEEVKRYPKERDIWYIKMWINIWVEENWKWDFLRPVLVIKKIWILVFCIALSTQYKENIFYKELNTCTFYDKKYEKDKSMIILSQWKTLDTKRFVKQIWYISKQEFIELKKLLKNMYF